MPSLAASPRAPLAVPAAAERFGFALFLALCLHAILILGLTFTPPERTAPSRPLEVVLVGSAGVVESALPQPAAPAHDAAENIPVELPAAPAPVAQAPQPAAPARERAEPGEPPSPVADALPEAQAKQRNYAALSGEIAALGLAIANDAAAGAPRIRQLSSRTEKNPVEAAYLEMWRARVERIGTANYPGNGVAGELRMQVVIRDDGALLDARIIEPSGVAAVDAAALRIVRLAAPFAQFPVEMRKAYDQLEVTRTWRFSRDRARVGG